MEIKGGRRRIVRAYLLDMVCYSSKAILEQGNPLWLLS